mgnify:CR=1 FL=1
MINLELPKKLTDTQDMAYAVAKDMFRPIARKYDTIEHTDGDIPELKVLGEMMESMAGGGDKKASKAVKSSDEVVNGQNMGSVLGAQAMSYGCLGLMMSIPGFGLGNAAIIKLHNNDLILAEAAFVISADHEKIVIPSDAAFMESKEGVKQPFDFNGLVKNCGFSSVKYKFDKQGEESSDWVVAYPQ